MILAGAEFLLLMASNIILIAIGLCLFFAGFSLLEAFLPSLISRTAPLARKGSALGLYSCAQFLGIFVGGLSGGWLYGKFGFSIVFLYCISFILLWLVVAYFMQPLRYFITHVLRLLPQQQADREILIAKLRTIPGVIEINVVAEDDLIYLRIEQSSLHHPDFIRLKEQLQS